MNIKIIWSWCLQLDVDFRYQLNIPYKKINQILQFLSNVFASIGYRLQVAGKMFNSVTHTVPKH